MEGTEPKARLQAAAVIVSVLFAALLGRLWQLQVVGGEAYLDTSRENRIRVERVAAPRGIIYDRSGHALVKNAAYYFVAIVPEMAERADVGRIAAFLAIAPEEVAERINARDKRNPFEPIRLKGGLGFDEVAFIESRISDYPELAIEAEDTRFYPYGDVGAHLIGYLGKLNPQQARQMEMRDLPPEEFVGQWGVEMLHNDLLRGKPGSRTVEVDALGRRLRVLGVEPPESGGDLTLSIDIALQQEAEAAFEGKVGALVAIRPRTGEVLALVSKPSFNPNLFARGIDYAEWVRLSGDASHPMLNRALQSQYPPGSTFKIITAVAAMEEGGIEPRHEEYCPGELKKGRWTFRCWNRTGHGSLNMIRALVESCDIYFYRTGENVGIDTIARYARAFGLGSESGLGLVAERSGLVPDTAWKQRTRGEQWYLGETYNAAIGQGYVLATPVQMARMIAAVSTGGYLPPLTLLKLDHGPEAAGGVPLLTETVRAVREAMAGVVTDRKGTGRAAHSSMVSIAGKTGTAQVVSQKDDNVDEGNVPRHLRDHAWFVAFAPVNEPEIALAVFVEHGGHGGSAAAPIARRAIEAYLGREETRQ
jgi:penicillin-binding protein 2